jgi:hypothetical protein
VRNARHPAAARRMPVTGPVAPRGRAGAVVRSEVDGEAGRPGAVAQGDDIGVGPGVGGLPEHAHERGPLLPGLA